MKPVHLEVNLDDVLTRVGVFGRWQQKIVFMLMIASFIGGKIQRWNWSSKTHSTTDSGLTVMNTAVTAAVPDDFQCFSPDPACQDPWVDGWLYTNSSKNCSKPLLPFFKAITLPEIECGRGAEASWLARKESNYQQLQKMCKAQECALYEGVSIRFHMNLPRLRHFSSDWGSL